MLILTNFKHYPSAILENAEKLVQDHISVSEKTGVPFAVAIGALDIQNIAQKFSDHIDIYAQHCDIASFGSSTGKILPEMLVKIGVKGVILNHSEHRFLEKNVLKETISFAKEKGLKVVCCAESAEEGEWIASNTNADFVAVEPPELIGGDISVSTAKPELISKSVEKIGAGKVLVGAGVKNGEDIRIAKKLGAVGVLLASGVTKSEYPKSVLESLSTY